MYIYKTTNLINNKIYIGLSTKSVSESTDYYGSGANISKAIKKYGSENFTKEILASSIESKEELVKLEIYWIDKYNSTERHIGYNISPGGDLNPDSQRVAIYKYSPEGDFIAYYSTIEDAKRETKDANLYRKQQRDNRPLKGFWYTTTEHTKEQIIAKRSEYLTKRSESFKKAAAKRHADPVLAQFYKDNMREVRKNSFN